MGLESGTYIDDLVATNPIGASDQKNEGDDHFRLVKAVLKATLPNMAGRLSRVQEKTSEYTVVANDNTTVIEATGDGGWDLIMTAAAALGNGHYIVLINSSTGDVTIDPDGAELVAGAATLVIAAGQTCALYCTGTEFLVHAGVIDPGTIVLLASLNAFAGINTFSKSLGPEYMNNVRFAASVATNALTVDLQGNDGNDPSATNPVELAFRHATATNGSHVVVQATEALTIVLAAGGSLGFAADEDGFIHGYLINNAGTLALALSRHGNFDETDLVSTTAIGADADDALTMYSTVARSNVAFRYIGKLRITTGATAGNWDTSATELHPARALRPAHGGEYFDADGTFTVPAGVFWLEALLWGAGAGAGGADNNGNSSGGGGAGAFCQGWLAVVPGQAITIIVGLGGNGGSGAANGTAGGATTILTLIAGGGSASVFSNSGGGKAGANGGTASGGTINFDGGDGEGAGSPANSGGKGGNCPGGGQGGRQISSLVSHLNGRAGQVPGGGGNGAFADSTTNRTGGAGADGAAYVRW